MNKIFSIIATLFNLFFLCTVLQLFTSISKADHVAHELPTQANKQTDLFESSVDGLSDFTNKLEAGKQNGIDSMGGGHGSPQGLKYITQKSKAELSGESAKLESIHENDLAGKGREEMIKSNSLNELHTDYARPLNKQHLKDAKTIAAAQDELLQNLLGKLKDLGVDCKTIKGDKKVEPEYFLQTKKTNHKDTLYNQTFCEELRNKYNCRDTATLRCKKRGMKWNPWQNQEMLLDGDWIYWNHMGWVYPIKWKSGRYGLHMRQGHPVVMAELRTHIANTRNVPIENINPQVDFEPRGEGHTNNVCDDLNSFAIHRIRYQIRDGHEVCEEWSEDWTERCTIK
jgi:hypothetical protein